MGRRSHGGEALAGATDQQRDPREGLTAYVITDNDAPSYVVVAQGFDAALATWRANLVVDHDLTEDEARISQPISVERLCDVGEVLLPKSVLRLEEALDALKFAEELRSMLPDDLSEVWSGDEAVRASELCGFIAVLSGRVK